MKYEYKVNLEPLNLLQDIFDACTQAGWRVVTCQALDQSTMCLVVLERPIPDEPEQTAFSKRTKRNG